MKQTVQQENVSEEYRRANRILLAAGIPSRVVNLFIFKPTDDPCSIRIDFDKHNVTWT